MIWRQLRRVLVLVSVGVMLPAAAAALSWFPMGPFGGDARSFAADPNDSQHIYLGTETGWVYESHDNGANWTRLSRVSGKRDDLVVDHILTDPNDARHLIVGVWKIDRPDGGIYISNDGGHVWYEQAEMRGQSVRSMARSLSDPRIVVAGTLAGVFRSIDNGAHWTQISQVGSVELHEVESVAIDPVNPEIIYAGTWHLPWKTVDGGAHWVNIKRGIIDDSDVFSIIVDPNKPSTVYASACSGIYKSTDAGALFKGGVTLNKLQGIPSTARRTRKLLQDPRNPQTVYAGTTEGLYRTLDGGDNFQLMKPDVIVNDVYVDPKNPDHVLLATDRGGVLSSDNAALSFHASNTGFSARQISAYAADTRSKSTMYVGVVNDKATGGVFQSVDGGVTWAQKSDGLGGRDVFSLLSTMENTLLAGTAHGIFRLGPDGWTESDAMVAAPKSSGAPKAPVKRVVVKGKIIPPLAATAPVAAAPQPKLDTIVYAMSGAGDIVYAATSQGLLRGGDDGRDWSQMSALQMRETHFVATQGAMILVAGLKRMELSVDGGVKWDAVALPGDLTQIATIAIDEQKNLWVGGTEGAYYSTDYGLTWTTPHNLYVTQVNGLYFDAEHHQMLVTSSNQTFAFGVQLPDYKVRFWDAGWNLRFVRPIGDHLIGATMFDGMVLQPRMVDSALH